VFVYGLEVGEYVVELVLVDVGYVDVGGLFGYWFLCLFFGVDE